MEKQGFLGTIGWIKGNLLTSSDIGKKYSNDTFYPGAPNIPNSAGPVPIAIPGTVYGKLDENNILSGYYKFNKRYGFTSSSSSSMITGVQITFKLLKNISSERSLAGYSSGTYIHVISPSSTSGKYKMGVTYAQNSYSYSDPIIEKDKWYTYRCWRNTSTNKAISMEIKQGSNVLYSNTFSYGSKIASNFIEWLVVGNGATSSDYCQVNLSGDKTFIW